MSVEPEVQEFFDKLMATSRDLGSEMADIMVNTNPPPWAEEWFNAARGNVVDAVGTWYRQNHPDYSDTLIANAQVRALAGFDDRICDLVARMHIEGGHA